MPFDVEDNLFLLPGPVKIHPRILRAMQRPAVAHRGNEFKRVIRRMGEGLRILLQTKKAGVFAMTASATGAMEAAVASMVRPGQKFVVAHNGKFGERFAEIARRHAGKDVVEVRAPYGRPIDAAQVSMALEGGDVRALAMVVNESSTGVRNPIEAVAEACRKRDVFLIADGVTAFGGMDVPTDKLGIDVAVCGSQKAVGAPPGLAFVSVGWDAESELKSPGLYLDLKSHLDKWRNDTTPFTPATHLFLAAHEALLMLEEESLEARVIRNRAMAWAFRTAISGMGLELVASPGSESDTITAVRYPDGVGDDEIRNPLKDKWGIIVAGGQNELKGRIFRVAHMGFTAPRELASCLLAVESCLAAAAKTTPKGAAAAAFADLVSRKLG